MKERRKKKTQKKNKTKQNKFKSAILKSLKYSLRFGQIFFFFFNTFIFISLLIRSINITHGGSMTDRKKFGELVSQYVFKETSSSNIDLLDKPPRLASHNLPLSTAKDNNLFFFIIWRLTRL